MDRATFASSTPGGVSRRVSSLPWANVPPNLLFTDAQSPIYTASALEKCENGAKLVVCQGVIYLPRPKSKKQSVRLSVTLDEGEYAELTRLGGELDLSAAWMIRRAVSEFVARHREGVEADLPLRRPETDSPGNKKAGGSRGT